MYKSVLSVNILQLPFTRTLMLTRTPLENLTVCLISTLGIILLRVVSFPVIPENIGHESKI